MGDASFAGIAVGIWADATAADNAAARALLDALNAEGVSAALEEPAFKRERFPAVVHADGVKPNTSGIRLYIGAKP